MEYFKIVFLLNDIESSKKLKFAILILGITLINLSFKYIMRKEPKSIKETFRVDSNGSRIFKTEKEFR